MRLHQRRKTDFRRGRAVGLLDHILQWKKPRFRSLGLRKKDYLRLPKTLKVREVRCRIEAKGFRTESVTLVTTLLDAMEYPTEDLAELYFRRWDIEVDFRHIKTTMGMDILRGKTPDIVRKEIWIHLLTYNLARSAMWEAAQRSGVPPGRISFKGAIQQMMAFRDIFASAGNSRKATAFKSLLGFISEQVVPWRPSRFEPRVRKRRPKSFPFMTKPRAQLKAAMGA